MRACTKGLRVDKKVVLITGCSSGIGKALSIAFHNNGYRVVATARRLDSIDDLKSKGITVERLDVTHQDDIDRVVHTVLAREGRIDCLVNNAGFGLIAPLLDVPIEEMQRQFHTNVFGPVQMIRAVAPAMRKNNRGTIINIGSISGIVTTPFAGAYCASKAALNSLSDALRLELAPFGIHVVCIQPGGIESNFGNASGASVQRVMKPGSWYASIREFIDKRAQESQSNPMPADELAKKIVSIVAATNPPAIVRTGTRSFMLPFLKAVLPTAVLDSVFKKRFGLHKISSAA
jgi:NAD(P)-dependent dehydrogenase (short-subunit alcohol dehydrogenase family)